MAKVICNDGTAEEIVSDTAVVPCEKHGGVNENPSMIDKWRATLTNTQKWGIVIVGTGVLYYILHKTGSLK